jgi:hypothetical protein
MLGFLLLVLGNCSTTETKPGSSGRTVLEDSKLKDAPSEQEFEKLPEGFINSNTFQVVVSSLKSNPTDAESEGLMVAKKKAFQMLLAYPKASVSSDGRKELKTLSESGKIVRKSQPGSKTYFVYQIHQTALETLVKSKIK